MERKTTKLAPSKFEVVAKIDEKVWKEAQEKAFKKLASELELKGFRKGKVPTEMARKHIQQAHIYNEAINASMQPAFEEVLKEEKLEPFARPSVDVTKVSDTELELKFIIITAPEVTLGAYKDFNVKKEEVKVEDKEVEDEIAKLLKQNADLVPSENAAKIGDTVVIDFVGSVDGVEFDGGKADNFSLELGSNQFVPGFEEQLIGAKANDNVEVNVTFPTQYVPELAGKKALFKVLVHEVKEKVIPELNEESIKDFNLPNVKTVEELRAYQKANIGARKEEAATSKAFDEIMKEIVKDAKIDIAEEILADEVAHMKENMNNQLAQRGMNLEQYLQIVGQKMEEIEAKMKEDADRNLRVYLSMEKISEVENITVEESDIEFEMAKIADQYKMELAKVKEILGKDLNRFAKDIKQRRIRDFILNNNLAK